MSDRKHGQSVLDYNYGCLGSDSTKCNLVKLLNYIKKYNLQTLREMTTMDFNNELVYYVDKEKGTLYMSIYGGQHSRINIVLSDALIGNLSKALLFADEEKSRLGKI